MKKGWILVLLILAAVIAAAIWYYNPGGRSDREASVYLIPQDYRGQVKVYFDAQNAGPVPREAGKLLFAIGKDGTMRTSDAMQEGFAADQYYYVDETGHRTPIDKDQMIHGKAVGGRADEGDVIHFFVGTKEEFEKWVAPSAS